MKRLEEWGFSMGVGIRMLVATASVSLLTACNTAGGGALHSIGEATPTDPTKTASATPGEVLSTALSTDEASADGAAPVEAAPQAEAKTPLDTTLPNSFTALDEPTDEILEVDGFKVWSTNYYTPIYETGSEGIPLLGPDNQPISGPIKREQWCNAALQGTVSLKEPDGTVTAYVFADQSGPEQVDCDDQLGNLSDSIKTATRKIRFSKVEHPYGCGVRNWPLIPFRTIAVDQSIIPYQTTLYLPSLAGKSFEIDGVTFTHDGFVYSADRGGAIRDNQIDFFSGNSRRVPFTDVVTSDEDRTVEAFIVNNDSQQAAALKSLHEKPCSG